METMKIGNITLTWLDGGVTHMDGGAMFGVVPKPLWSKKYPVNEKNQIELRTDPILIQKDGLNIIIDA
ncbi:MBL fold metallo-hydrolase, partial [Enterococcus faecalis]